MKIQLASDLHLEGGRYELPKADRDVLILAGDIQVGTRHKDWILDQASDGHVIYVPGNHEYYRHEKWSVDGEWFDIADADPFLSYASRASIWIGGVKFVCASFWPNCWGDPVAQMLSRQYITDYKAIMNRETGELWTPADAAKEHEKDLEWLKQEIEPGCVVVTHWPPISWDCVAPEFLGDKLNPYFVNHCPELFLKDPVLWICGHTHYAVDFVHENTRIVNNPRGYASEKPCRRIYQPEFIVEI